MAGATLAVSNDDAWRNLAFIDTLILSDLIDSRTGSCGGKLTSVGFVQILKIQTMKCRRGHRNRHKKPTTYWRPMLGEDLAQVNTLAHAVHLNYPEDAAVFSERQQLYPAGCYVLTDGKQILGYILSHPGSNMAS